MLGSPRLHDSHTTRVLEDRINHKSKQKSPVKLCWEIFDEVKKKLGDTMTRKLAIDTAERRGIAFYTARTQYQEWKKAGDNDSRTRDAQVKKYGVQGVINLQRIGIRV